MGTKKRLELMDFDQVTENRERKHKTSRLVRASPTKAFGVLGERSHPGSKIRMQFYS